MRRRDQNLQDSLRKRAREMSPKKDNDNDNNEQTRYRRTHATTRPRVTEPGDEEAARPRCLRGSPEEPTIEFTTIGQPVRGLDIGEAASLAASESPEEADTRPRQTFAMPRAPTMRTENWVPGRTVRTGHIDSRGQPRLREEVEEGNLMHMSYVADRHFEDAKHARETMERMQKDADRAAYHDRKHQRLSHERQQMDAQQRTFQQHREAMQAQERMKMYANKREYDDRESERQTLARIERERLEHERKQAEMQQRAIMEKERENARQRQQELDHVRQLTLQRERFNVELERAKQQELRRQREAEALLQISGLKLTVTDRESQRKHEQHMAALDKLEQLVRAQDMLADNAQSRRFKEIEFRDSRVGKHEQFVKLEREQAAINRNARLLKIFKEFGINTPDEEDLNIPQITPPQRLLERKTRIGYVHSFLVIGAIDISRLNPNRPKAVFLDGSVISLPAWNDGFLIHAERLDRTVWLIHVHQAPYTMPVQKDDDESNSDDLLWCKNCCRLCNVQ